MNEDIKYRKPEPKKEMTHEELVALLQEEAAKGNAVVVTIHLNKGNKVERIEHIFHFEAKWSMVIADFKKMTKQVAMRMREMRNEYYGILAEPVVPEGDELEDN